ncbi:MAG TPA: hypothetical protein VNV42_02940 [Solirubrobacteraceae bacterium]|jgi:hypothetical protein|nr:hypothetical protein [Solirubrobacteraceae bacterium]
MSQVQLDAMVEEATIDCHDKADQVTGLLTVVEDELTVPFKTRCRVWRSPPSAWTRPASTALERTVGCAYPVVVRALH